MIFSEAPLLKTGPTVKRGRSKQDYAMTAENLHHARTQQNRFWAKLQVVGDCWEWSGQKDKDGYGKFQVTLPRLKVGKERQWHVRAHRLAYILWYGTVPGGKLVLHECDNPRCCNPHHLKLGTQQTNRTDAVNRGRVACGETHGMAKLTESEAQEVIKQRQRGVSVKQIASKFNLSISTVYQIGKRLWRHLQ